MTTVTCRYVRPVCFKTFGARGKRTVSRPGLRSLCIMGYPSGCDQVNRKPVCLEAISPCTKSEKNVLKSCLRSLSLNGTFLSRRRALSTSPTNLFPGQTPSTDFEINMEQALGTAETVLLYLEHGNPGKELDKIRQRNSESIGKRYRDMMACFLQTQLHVVVPFGFSATEKGVHEFAAALMKLMGQSNNPPEDVAELQKISQETMALMLKRAFGLEEIPQLEIGKVRYLASLVSSNMQNEEFLNQAERLYKEKIEAAGSDNKKLLEAHTILQDELLVPCYLNALKQAKIEEIPQSDIGYVVVQTLITQHSGDAVVAQNMASALMALNTRAPIMHLPPT